MLGGLRTAMQVFGPPSARVTLASSSHSRRAVCYPSASVRRSERPPMAARSTQTTILARSARRAVRKVRNHGGSPNIKLVKELGERLSVPENEPEYAGPDHLRELRDSYRPADDLPLVDGRVPLVWWTDTPNFGDLLSPWLVGRIARRPVVFAPREPPELRRRRLGGDPGPPRLDGLGFGLVRQRAAVPVQVLRRVPRGPGPAHPQPAPRRRHRLPAGLRRPCPARADALLAGGGADPRGRHRDPALRAPVARRRSRTAPSR